jgi:hypothetical protein
MNLLAELIKSVDELKIALYEELLQMHGADKADPDKSVWSLISNIVDTSPSEAEYKIRRTINYHLLYFFQQGRVDQLMQLNLA